MIDNIFEKKFDGWNKKLLDLTRRNRLLNHKDKIAGTYIFEEDAIVVYDKLVNNKGYIFEVDFSGKNLDEMKDIKDRTRKLENIRKTIRNYNIERGFNIGFVAIGFLEWTDDGNSISNNNSSPLILIPIEITRESMSKPIEIKFKKDEEIHLNPVILKKISDDFGVHIDENYEVTDISEALDFLTSKLSLNGWKINNKVVLDTFDFQNLVIQKDLEKNKDMVKNNKFIKALCSDNGDNQSNIFSSFNDDVDVRNEDPELRMQILDADSSQQEAISRARRGDSFVLQGPPGTGKSQTITNIIAEALGQGKKVLFVSEKQAALDVVHAKLKDNGIGDFILTLHNVNQNKSDIRNQLSQSLNYSGKNVSIPNSKLHTYDKVKGNSIKLNVYSDVLHKEQKNIKLSFFQIHGLLSDLYTAEDVIFDIDDSILNEDFERIEEIFSDVKMLGESYLTTSQHHKNDGWRFSRKDFTMVQISEIKKTFNNFLENYKLLEELKEGIDKVFPTSVKEEDLVNFINNIEILLSKKNGVVSEKNIDSDLFTIRNKLNDRIKISKNVDTLNKENKNIETEILEKYDKPIDDFDNTEVDLKLLKYEYKSFFKRLISNDYKQMYKKYRFMTKELKISYAQLVYDLKLIEDYKLNSSKINENLIMINNNGVSINHLLIDKLNFNNNEEIQGINWLIEFKELMSNNETEYIINIELMKRILIGEIRDFSDILFKANNQYDQWLILEQIKESIFKNFFDLDSYDNENLVKFIKNFTFDTNTDYFANLRLKNKFINNYGLGNFISEIESKSIEHTKILNIFKKRFYLKYLSNNREYSILSNESGRELNQRVSSFKDDDIKSIKLARERVLKTLIERLPNVNEDIKTTGGEIQILKRELKKKTRMISTRKLIEQLPTLLPRLKPCIMMSPLTVSTYFSSNPDWIFDLVIFDEASQVRPEFAISAISRAKQIVVSGDSKQMPPTTFFGAVTNDDDLVNEDEDIEDLESILDELSVVIPETYLNWHYRSKDESLITFSNRNFYDDKLYTFPSQINGDKKAVKFTYIENGVWETQYGNIVEAKAVAKVVHNHVLNRSDKSLGIVAFGKKQAQVIEDEINHLRELHPNIEEFFNENKEDSFFIKNLENVQGDERDVIILAVGYGPTPKGTINMNFGPLINTGGERRLNVAVTRAREEMHVISSLKGSDIRVNDTKNQNRVIFRDFLLYAEFGVKMLPGYNIDKENHLNFDSIFEEKVYEFLTSNGYEVHSQAGESEYRIDLAVVDPYNKGRYAIAIECDGAAYHSSRTARDRDRLRQDILEAKGWIFYRIWSTTWIHDNVNEKERLIKAIEEAINNSDEVPVGKVESIDDIIIVDKILQLPKYFGSDVYQFENNIDDLAKIMMRASEDLVGYTEEDLFKFINKKVFDKKVMSKGYRGVYKKALYRLVRSNNIIFKNDVIVRPSDL